MNVHSKEKAGAHDDLVERARQVIRERVCTVCMEGLPGGECGLPEGRECPLLAKMPQIIGIVASTHDARIEPYQRKVGKLICEHCTESQPDGDCPHRHDASCALDRYVPWIIEMVDDLLTAEKLKRRS